MSFPVHRGILVQSPLLALLCEQSNVDILQLPNVLPSHFSLLLKYLYTGNYQVSLSARFLNDGHENGSPAEFWAHASLYCIARVHKLHDLIELTIKKMEIVGELEFRSLMDIAKKIYPELKDDDIWFTEYFKKEIRRALIENAKLVEEQWILDVIRNEGGRLAVDLFKTLVTQLTNNNVTAGKTNVPLGSPPEPAPRTNGGTQYNHRGGSPSPPLVAVDSLDQGLSEIISPAQEAGSPVEVPAASMLPEHPKGEEYPPAETSIEPDGEEATILSADQTNEEEFAYVVSEQPVLEEDGAPSIPSDLPPEPESDRYDIAVDRAPVDDLPESCKVVYGDSRGRGSTLMPTSSPPQEAKEDLLVPELKDVEDAWGLQGVRKKKKKGRSYVLEDDLVFTWEPIVQKPAAAVEEPAAAFEESAFEEPAFEKPPEATEDLVVPEQNKADDIGAVSGTSGQGKTKKVVKKSGKSKTKKTKPKMDAVLTPEVEPTAENPPTLTLPEQEQNEDGSVSFDKPKKKKKEEDPEASETVCPYRFTHMLEEDQWTNCTPCRRELSAHALQLVSMQ